MMFIKSVTLLILCPFIGLFASGCDTITTFEVYHDSIATPSNVSIFVRNKWIDLKRIDAKDHKYTYYYYKAIVPLPSKMKIKSSVGKDLILRLDSSGDSFYLESDPSKKYSIERKGFHLLGVHGHDLSLYLGLEVFGIKI